MRAAVWCLLLWLSAVLPAAGLVNCGNPGGNRNCPTGENGEPADPGFAYVGFVGGATGVYLGNGWVLTARHLPARDVRIEDTVYPWDGASDYKFPNAELRLFRLSEWPDMPALPITSSTPKRGQLVVMVGVGRDCADQVTYWQVNRATEPWTWTEVPSREQADAAGILSHPASAKSWGTNRISGLTEHPKLGALIVTDFTEDPSIRTPYEAQAVSHDSGGAVFVEDEDGWKLAGIIATVTKLYPGQPGVEKSGKGTLQIGSGVFGNLTLAVNLAPYRHKILEITGLEAE
ncbi:hypothetical protein H5P28_16255 [Ruficoccus amylovorans]|uniref:Serine protease n=1 Tax=Ruficoccus amylovorans TaxID=1804625 RepID=A0A842HHL3_9BACT|nr:hypothetical protein [Ruficoccus amylovorans]MBC2595819.1 hypothetical protein [Ruficoccus amylovorans]